MAKYRIRPRVLTRIDAWHYLAAGPGLVDTDFTSTYNCAGEFGLVYLISGDPSMAEALETDLQDTVELTTCDRCGRRSGKGWSFAFRKPVPEGAEDEGILIKCSRCAIRHHPMIRRSLMVALVVGTILTLLNQGDILFAGSWKGALYWKVPLTYCVPFCVATYGALSNARR